MPGQEVVVASGIKIFAGPLYGRVGVLPSGLSAWAGVPGYQYGN